MLTAVILYARYAIQRHPLSNLNKSKGGEGFTGPGSAFEWLKLSTFEEKFSEKKINKLP